MGIWALSQSTDRSTNTRAIHSSRDIHALRNVTHETDCHRGEWCTTAGMSIEIGEHIEPVTYQGDLHAEQEARNYVHRGGH